METARLALRKGDLTAISGTVPGEEGRIWFQVCCWAQTCREQAVAAMWDSHSKLESYQILGSLGRSHHALVNRNDQLSRGEVEFAAVVSRHQVGIAHLNLSVRGLEEKQISAWQCQSILYWSNYRESYGMHQCLYDLPSWLTLDWWSWVAVEDQTWTHGPFLACCIYICVYLFDHV